VKPGGPLRRLLRVREIREEQARATLSLANRAATEAQGRLRDREREYDGLPGLPATLNPAQLRGLMLQGVAAHDLVHRASDEYLSALGQVEDARAGWSSASADLKSAEKLENRRRLEYERVARSAAERALDEMVLTMRGAQRWV
jgi:flagellar export protein FliJ